MEIVITVLVVIAVAIPIGVVVATWGLRGPEIIGAGFTGYRPDAWPHGVQERDEPWSWRPPEPKDTEADPVAVEPVGRPRIGSGWS
jgi:hypothetical protein